MFYTCTLGPYLYCPGKRLLYLGVKLLLLLIKFNVGFTEVVPSVGGWEGKRGKRVYIL